MTWFKVDDSFYDHPKVEAIVDLHGGSPIGLWTLAGSWSARQLTDGYVPSVRVSRLGFSDEDAEALVHGGLWEEVGGGYQFKDWADYQPTKSQINQARASGNARVTRYRSRQRNALQAHDSNDDVTHVDGPSARDPDPTRSELTLPNGSSSESGSASADVRRVFECWVSKFWSGKGPRPKLDAKRRARITARLKAFSAGQLCQALGNVGSWHIEQGHTGLQTLLRDDEAVERHLGALGTAHDESQRRSRYTPEEILAMAQRDWDKKSG